MAKKEVKSKKAAPAEKSVKAKKAAPEKAVKGKKAAPEKETKAKKAAPEKESKKSKKAAPEKEAKKGKKAAPEKEGKKSAKSKLPVLKEKLTATQMIANIAERAETDNKTVKAVLEASQDVVVETLRKGGAGVIKLLGWNFKSVLKPAVKGGEKKANPFKKGEFIITKSKPASMKLKALPLKAIKDAVTL